MGYDIWSTGRAALLAGALVTATSVLAPPAGASEDPGIEPGETEIDPPPYSGSPFVPRCFGEPATIVMTTPGQQTGTSGDDVIIGTGGDDFIDSLGGHDLICAGGGVDRITADYDPVTGRWDPLIIVVGEPSPDDDYIDGQDDGDVVTPGAGDDFVWGSDGSDYLYGQGGDDTIEGGDHQDWMDCSEGRNDYADGGRGSNDWVSTDHGCETLISAAP